MTATLHTVRLQRFDELWIHTGTACNLECPFCLEGSRPGDNRLERIKLNEIKPYLDQAAQLGVNRFCFTGGEPLIVKDIVKILEYALDLKPCMVITNGTAPLLKRLHQLQALKQHKHALSFSISIDHPDQQHHDKDRGWGNFQRAIEGLQLLHAQGFSIAIIRQIHNGEDQIAIVDAYKTLLRKAHLPDDIVVHALPDFGKFGAESHAEETQSPGDVEPLTLKCSHSRMLIKRSGKLVVGSCLFTDDDASFDLGNSLDTALSTDVKPAHYRCQQCFSHRISL